MDSDRIRFARDDQLDPSRLVERQELQARAYEDLARALESFAYIPGAGLDLFRRTTEQGADAAYRLATLARTDVPGTLGDPTAVERMRATAPELEPRARQYVADLLGPDALRTGDTVTVDMTSIGGGRTDHVVESVTPGPTPTGEVVTLVRHPAAAAARAVYTRECRIHATRYPCEGGCYGRRPVSTTDERTPGV